MPTVAVLRLLEAILVNQLADVSIASLHAFLGRHIAVSPDLHIKGCDGSLTLTAAWFEENEIEAASGLDWIKAHGPDCSCDCEIYTYLHAHSIGAQSELQKTNGR